MKLTELFVMVDLHFTPEQVELFERFLADVELLGTPLGLTEAKGESLVLDHLMDSLSPYKMIESLGLTSLADVGSGAGFPGLVLAIAFPQIQVTLIERMEKRARFLQMMIAKLRLTNVTVFHGDVKNIEKTFDAITFRALTQMECSLATLLLKRSPQLLAYKGRLALINEEVKMLNACGYNCQIESLVVPYSEKERNLLRITKNKD